MPFQVIAPIMMPVDGKDWMEATKNFIKLQRHLNIEQLILTDQLNNMHARIRYYDMDGRHKAAINIIPTVATTLVGFSSTDKDSKYPGIIGPSHIIGPDNQLIGLKKVEPITTDGKKPGELHPEIIHGFGPGMMAPGMAVPGGIGMAVPGGVGVGMAVPGGIIGPGMGF
jgi:hypothetical protein